MSSPAARKPDRPRGSDQQPLRTDAERNRSRIVAAARQAFAEHGLDVPMKEVARRAGVGVGTLYRRFPTREDLITGVFADKMTAYADAVDAALADPDPWHGFCGYVEQVCAMQAADRGFSHVLTLTFPMAKAFEAERERAYRGFTALVARAKEARGLRRDFSPEDLVLLLMANAGVATATGEAAPEAWRRFTSYMIQAFAADHPDTLPPAPTPAALYRAMFGLRPHGTSQ